MAKVYRVTLTADERAGLEALVRKGSGAALRLTRARILLKATSTGESSSRSRARFFPSSMTSCICKRPWSSRTENSG